MSLSPDPLAAKQGCRGETPQYSTCLVDRFFSKQWAAPLSLLGLSLLILLAYSKTIHGALQFDDTIWITKTPIIRDLANLPAILTGKRGLTTATFAINYAIGGTETAGYHLVNIAIHIINTVLVYILLTGTLVLAGFTLPRARLLSLLMAALFSLHPVQTQAVTYIVQRMETLSALFTLLALICFVKAAKTALPLKKYIYYAIVPAAYIAAFYSKEIAITLPALVLLYDIYFMSFGMPIRILKKWPLYAGLFALLIYFTITTVMPLGGFSDISRETALATATVKLTTPASEPAPAAPAQPQTSAAAGAETQTTAPGPATKAPVDEFADLPPLQSFPTAGFGVPTTTPYQYFLTEANVLLYYYSLLILPINQNVDYDFPLSKGLWKRPKPNKGTRLTIPLPPPIISIIIHLSLLALALFLYLRSLYKKSPSGRCISFFIIWFFLILSPTSTFIPIIDVIFEHRLYLASLGYAVILILILEKILIRRKPPSVRPTR